MADRMRLLTLGGLAVMAGFDDQTLPMFQSPGVA